MGKCWSCALGHNNSVENFGGTVAQCPFYSFDVFKLNENETLFMCSCRLHANKLNLGHDFSTFCDKFKYFFI